MEKIYKCKNCGAEIKLKESTIFDNCPFCKGIIMISSYNNPIIKTYYLPCDNNNYNKIYLPYYLVNAKLFVQSFKINTEQFEDCFDFQYIKKTNKYLVELKDYLFTEDLTIRKDISKELHNIDLSRKIEINDINELKVNYNKYYKIEEDKLCEDLIYKYFRQNDLINRDDKIYISIEYISYSKIYIPFSIVKNNKYLLNCKNNNNSCNFITLKKL